MSTSTNTTNQTRGNSKSGFKPGYRALGIKFLQISLAIGFGVTIALLASNFFFNKGEVATQSASQSSTAAQVATEGSVVTGTRTAQNAIMDPANAAMIEDAYNAGVNTFIDIMMSESYTAEQAAELQSAIAPMVQELLGVTPTPDEAVAIFFLGNDVMYPDLRAGLIGYEWFNQYYAATGFAEGQERNAESLSEISTLREIVQQNIHPSYFTLQGEDMYDEAIHDFWAKSLTDFNTYFHNPELAY